MRRPLRRRRLPIVRARLGLPVARLQATYGALRGWSTRRARTSSWLKGLLVRAPKVGALDPTDAGARELTMASLRRVSGRSTARLISALSR